MPSDIFEGEAVLFPPGKYSLRRGVIIEEGRALKMDRPWHLLRAYPRGQKRPGWSLDILVYEGDRNANVEK